MITALGDFIVDGGDGAGDDTWEQKAGVAKGCAVVTHCTVMPHQPLEHVIEVLACCAFVQMHTSVCIVHWPARDGKGLATASLHTYGAVNSHAWQRLRHTCAKQ